MHGRATITVLVASAFLASMFAITPSGLVMNASAADPEYGYFETRGPSANNSTFYRINPDPTGPNLAYGAQIEFDGYSNQLEHSSDATFWLECSDYSNESYPSSTEYETIPENATIREVWIVAEFTANRPDMSLRLNTEDYEYSNSTYVGGGYGSYFWNVTDLQDWDHDLLTDNETVVGILASTDAYVQYYVSYLGFYKIVWQGWYEGEAGEGAGDPPDEGGADVGYDIVYTNIPGLLGFMGFFGMIAVPAFGVWVARNGESECAITLFVKILAAWFFCFAMFMYSVAG